MLITLSCPQSHAAEKEKRRAIHGDKRSAATILSITRMPLTVKVRFRNRNPHPVIIFHEQGLLERKAEAGWENLLSAFKDFYSGEDLVRKPRPPTVVKAGATVELRFTRRDEFKKWKAGETLRFTFLHEQREMDFPQLTARQRLRAMTTALYRSEHRDVAD